MMEEPTLTPRVMVISHPSLVVPWPMLGVSASGWRMLFPDQTSADHAIGRAALHRSVERLPHVLEGLV